MNAEDLRYFLAVRNAQSIKGGARTMRVDHSTVSRRIAALEEALGARLFERTPEGLVETDVARAIAPLAERIELMTRELKEAANAASEAPSGPVRIAVAPVLADHFLAPRLPALMRRFPDITFDIIADISRVNMLRREADIAIRQHPQGKAPAEPSAVATKVGSFGFALYASPSYLERHGRPASPMQSLEGHRMISTGDWAPGNSWNDQLDAPASYVLTVYPFAIALAAAVAGVGLAVLPCVAADRDSRLERLTEIVGAYDGWLVTNHEVRNNARVRGVKDALLEMLREGANELSGVRDGDRGTRPA